MQLETLGTGGDDELCAAAETAPGNCCTQLEDGRIAPCIYSVNAFGKKSLAPYSELNKSILPRHNP
jgi:hypothetical protein